MTGDDIIGYNLFMKHKITGMASSWRAVFRTDIFLQLKLTQNA